jgi:hypothetical protein
MYNVKWKIKNESIPNLSLNRGDHERRNTNSGNKKGFKNLC